MSLGDEKFGIENTFAVVSYVFVALLSNAVQN